FGLSESIDSLNNELKAKSNLIEDFATKLDNEIEFFTIRISKIPQNVQHKFLEDENLAEYKYLLKQLFDQAKYLLGEEAEKVINLKSKGAISAWVQMRKDFLSKEEAWVLNDKKQKRKLSFSQIISLVNNKDKKVRDTATKAFNEILKKHLEVAERELNSVLEYKKVEDELRKFNKPYSSTLFGDDIEENIVEEMTKTVTDNFEIAKKFYKLKAKLLKVKKLEYNERNLEYGKFTKKYSFDESYILVHNVFEDLDKDFSNIFNRQFENGCVDVFPKKGKSSGAFCTQATKGVNSFVLLNHTNRIDDVSTIAHEFGHSINHELSRIQNPFYIDTSIATAEVASTFFEDFVFKKLLEKSDDELKLSLILRKLDDDISTIFRQVACFNFELELHNTFREKGFLPAKEIGEIFAKHMKSYMGSYVKIGKDNHNWWVYWSHIRNFFYVYSYASGLLISKALQRETDKDKKFIEKVKIFLQSGSSKSPKDLFLDLGIDISKKEFWEEGVRECADLLKEAEVLAKKLKKI
nr:M3 family oligoendopeptidase [Patescibacteria group bacterium]